MALRRAGTNDLTVDRSLSELQFDFGTFELVKKVCEGGAVAQLEWEFGELGGQG